MGIQTEMSTIQTVEQATPLALDFVRKYYVSAFPVSTKKENIRWIVDLDISYYRSNSARLTIIAETGTIEQFKVTQAQLL